MFPDEATQEPNLATLSLEFLPISIPGPLLFLQARRGARVILDFCIDLGFTLLFSQYTCACSKSLRVPWPFTLVLFIHLVGSHCGSIAHTYLTPGKTAIDTISKSLLNLTSPSILVGETGIKIY